MKSETERRSSNTETPIRGPALPPSQLPHGTPEDIFERDLSGRHLLASSKLRHVGRVSKRAALATKKQIWDSNDASIVAAQNAVDQWEQGYNAMRGLLVAVGNSARGVYGAAKATTIGLEHGLLLPVRDWVLLPAFGGVEHVARETGSFLQSEHAERLAGQTLDIVRHVPLVGNFLAPALCIGAGAVKRTWEIAQYPIPSPNQVQESVDFVMTGTKWALSTAGREIFLYVSRADANITRTLSHTRWKVLGSGPYATLDKLNKSEVIDHLCERYFSLVDAVARYELAAHIRAHNRTLYHDLVLTGLLRERGGDLTSDDEWLSYCPSYRSSESLFLLDDESKDEKGSEAFSLWFRLPNQNGKKPGKDRPWVFFDRQEREKLEHHYRSFLKKHEKKGATISTHTASPSSSLDGDSQRYATNAKWYTPDLENDLFLDQKRHVVSFFPCCPKCRNRHDLILPPRCPKQFGELCDSCSEKDAPWVDALLSPPPVIAVYRPTMWRFYGPGDEVRRAAWYLDTPRNGLQPYGEDAQAVLEDAYLFLKWMGRRRVGDGGTLLTVQVPSPDGSEQHLVQFSSLESATAIGKGLGAAIALFKRRVYRGVYLPQNQMEKDKEPSPDTTQADWQRVTECKDNEEPDDLSLVDERTKAMMSDYEVLQEDENGKREAVTEIERVDPSFSFETVSDPSEEERTSTESIKISEGSKESPSLAFPLDQSRDGREWKDSEFKDSSDHIDHLVLIIHGIGEMLQTIDLFGLKAMPTIVDCCGYMRANHNEVLGVRFKQLYQTRDGIPQPRKGRVEYLPIEWHEAFTIQSQRRLLTQSAADSPCLQRNFTINDVSLRTIPQMRQFANDSLMDILYFMSPEHHDMIIDLVVHEMNVVVENFQKLTGFEGEISVVGHSLGSVIAWDILDNQTSSSEVEILGSDIVKTSNGDEPARSESVGVSSVESNTDADLGDEGTIYFDDVRSHGSIKAGEEKCLKRAIYPQLGFNVENAFMLGSPIGVFLMIRNQQKPLSTDFALRGCARVFNIFHPYDPVAYRIEPLLDPKNAEIDPKIMPHWYGGFRFQYQTKRMWRKIVLQTIRTQESVIETLESGIASLGLLDGAAHDFEDDDDIESGTSQQNSPRVVTGNLNSGQRIDFMLQEKEIENANEYVAALAAHSCYWLEKDLSLFIARQICLLALEREIGEETIPLPRHTSSS